MLKEDEAYQQKTQALREELDAMRAAATSFDQLHLAAAEEATKLKQAEALEQGQANILVKQVAALKRDNHMLKVCACCCPSGLGFAGDYQLSRAYT